MMNIKTGLLMALVGLLISHYVYVHDLLNGDEMIWMGSISWAIAAIAFLLALAGLWVIWRSDEDTAG
jgi:hypothetical protein